MKVIVETENGKLVRVYTDEKNVSLSVYDFDSANPDEEAEAELHRRLEKEIKKGFGLIYA